MVREDVAQLDFELRHHGFEGAEGDVALSSLQLVNHGRGNPDFFCELDIRQIAPFLTEELGELSIQTIAHNRMLAEKPYTMVNVLLDLEFWSGAVLPR